MRNPANAAAATQAADGEEEKKEEERPTASQGPAYRPASDPSFLIERSSNQRKAAP